MEIPKNIKDEIWEYCRLNDVTDIDTFMLNSLQQGFNIEKYGSTPFKINSSEPQVIEKEVIKEVEKIVEKVIEVPVEKIVEIEVIKEVEKIVEVTVEKEVYISDDNQMEELREKLIQSQKDSSKYLTAWEERLGELEVLDEKYNELLKTSSEQINESEQIGVLTSEISNLKIELELEKNRQYKPEKKEPIISKKTKKGGPGNIINWVSKDERDSDDIYND